MKRAPRFIAGKRSSANEPTDLTYWQVSSQQSRIEKTQEETSEK